MTRSKTDQNYGAGAGKKDKAFLDDVRRRLEQDKPVRRTLAQNGRLHIDRKQPFLCVYRRAENFAESHTERLIEAQASYVFASAREDFVKPLRDLVGEVCRPLSDAFGAVLVLEIWPAQDSKQPADMPQEKMRPRFRIVAPEQEVPLRTVRRLQRAVMAGSWSAGKPQVSIDFEKKVAPPGMAPVLSARRAKSMNATIIGLGVSPHYFDIDAGVVRPQVLREFRHNVGRALKQAFYTFSHSRATYRPAHYHALGRRSMTRAVWDTDKRLAAIQDQFDVLLAVTPVNSDAAWRRFKNSGYEKTPEFHYRPLTIDPAALKRELFSIPVDRIEDPTLHHLFDEKRTEIDRQLTLLMDRNTPRFLYASLLLYDRPADALVKLADDVLDAAPPDAASGGGKGVLGAKAFARKAEKELAAYRKQFPALRAGVEVRKDVPGLMVSQSTLMVGSDTRVPKERAEAMLHHEVGTHVLSHINGVNQPFQQFHAGMADYEALQEGIAVLSEYLVGGLSVARIRIIAARVLAAKAVIEGADFIETFRYLHKDLGFSQQGAFSIAMRIHRGGGYTKDIVYLQGLSGVLTYLGGGGSLEELLVGKISLNHVPFVSELRWRNIVKENVLRPRYFDDRDAMKRLEALAKGRTVLDLVKEVTG